MTDSIEEQDRPLDPSRAIVDLPSLQVSARQTRTRAAQPRGEVDTRRRQSPELADRGDQQVTELTAAEVAALRSRAEEAEDRADHLERALVSNRRIGMAIGILITRLRCTEDQAFDVLRRESMRRNVRVAQLAEQLVYTGTL